MLMIRNLKEVKEFLILVKTMQEDIERIDKFVRLLEGNGH